VSVLNGIDFVFMAGEDCSRIIIDCTNCPYGEYTIINECSKGYNDRPCYVNEYCSKSERIIYEFYIPVVRIPKGENKPHIPIPEWCSFRDTVTTIVPLHNVEKEATINMIVSGIYDTGGRAAFQSAKQGFNLIIEGELTTNIKEIIMEVLI